ncbi:hypothetical protein HDU77_009438 [Chytriomyces hyalinus]|nr:hypothetical protein HDU77_009438 [Chytriomyces hyalinus]
MLDEVNSYGKLLQMPILASIDSPVLTLSKATVSTTACPSIDTASLKPTLESMPMEILDQIALSFGKVYLETLEQKICFRTMEAFERELTAVIARIEAAEAARNSAIEQLRLATLAGQQSRSLEVLFEGATAYLNALIAEKTALLKSMGDAEAARIKSMGDAEAARIKSMGDAEVARIELETALVKERAANAGAGNATPAIPNAAEIAEIVMKQLDAHKRRPYGIKPVRRVYGVIRDVATNRRVNDVSSTLSASTTLVMGEMGCVRVASCAKSEDCTGVEALLGALPESLEVVVQRSDADKLFGAMGGDDILQLCHAVPYYKYISKAMHDFSHAIERHIPPRPVLFWPSIKVYSIRHLISKLTHSRRALSTYSRILSKHGGCALINELFGTESILGALPENIEVSLEDATTVNSTDNFFSTLFGAKKIVLDLSLGYDYIECCKSDAPTRRMTAKWLVKLPIHQLQFLGDSNLTEMLAVLHRAPMLSSLYISTLEDCAAIALSECKSLRELMLSNVFEGEESAEQIVQKLMDIVKETKIQKLEVLLPWVWHNFVPSDLKDLVAALFLQHGWHEQPAKNKDIVMGKYFAFSKQKMLK